MLRTDRLVSMLRKPSFDYVDADEFYENLDDVQEVCYKYYLVSTIICEPLFTEEWKASDFSCRSHKTTRRVTQHPSGITRTGALSYVYTG